MELGCNTMTNINIYFANLVGTIVISQIQAHLLLS